MRATGMYLRGFRKRVGSRAGVEIRAQRITHALHGGLPVAMVEGFMLDGNKVSGVVLTFN